MALRQATLACSTSPSPTGPWTYRGVIMDCPEGSFTTHPGVVESKGRNFIFYHSGQLDGGSGFRRSVCVEEFDYGEDGSIPYITMTKGTTPTDTSLTTSGRRPRPSPTARACAPARTPTRASSTCATDGKS